MTVEATIINQLCFNFIVINIFQINFGHATVKDNIYK